MEERIKKALLEYRDSEELQAMAWEDAAKVLKIGTATIGKFRVKLGLTRTADLQRRIEAMIWDEDFGMTGHPAPCPARVLAARHNVSVSVVQRRRKDKGISAHLRRYDPSPDDDEFYRRVASREEKENMQLCKMTALWGRPKEIDAHLEKLHESL